MQSSALGIESLGLRIGESPGLRMESLGLSTESPVLGIESLELRIES